MTTLKVFRLEGNWRSEKWDRASGTARPDAVKCTVTMSMAPLSLRNNVQLGTHANSAALRTALLQWCFSSRNFGPNPTQSAGNGTGADDDNKIQVDSLKKGNGRAKADTQKPGRKSHKRHKQHGEYRHQHVHELWQNGTLGGRLLEAYDNNTRNNSHTNKGKNYKKGKGKGKHMDVMETNQSSETASTVSFPSQTPSTLGELSCTSNVEPWIMGVTINSRVNRRTSWCRVFAS